MHALQDIDLDLKPGKTLAIVGASGSGKSTLARCIAGLEAPTSGEIRIGELKLSAAVAHRHVQMVFQDPGASLNPRFSVQTALREPLAVLPGWRPDSFNISDHLRQVGLSISVANRLTAKLSGGQKARLALARALIALGAGAGPAILILDESLTSLDLSVRAQMINLLVDLQERRALSYILITHDLDLAAHMGDEIAVMSAGKIVERRALPPHA